MFNLYRKVLDDESDSEERQSLKSEVPDERVDPKFQPLTRDMEKPRAASLSGSPVRQTPVPTLAKPQAPQHRLAVPPAQQAHFDPFSQSTPQQSATTSPEALQAVTRSTGHQMFQQQPSPSANHSFNDIISPPRSEIHMAPATQGASSMQSASLHVSSSSPSLAHDALTSPSPTPQLATHSFCDLLNESPPPSAPAAPKPASGSDSTATPEGPGVATAAGTSDPFFMRESDWDILSGSVSQPAAPASLAAPSGSAEPSASPSTSTAAWAQLEDLFEGVEGASAPMASFSAPAAGARDAEDSGAARRTDDMPETSAGSGPMGEAPGQFIEPRELLIYAIPLIKDRLVFLPVTAWQMDPEAEKQGFTGAVKSGFSKVTGSVSNWWSSLKEKEPDTLGHKVHKHGTVIMENMSAEERLMQNIPRNAQKLVVHHPASIDPSEVQEQLSKMTATYCVKSVGKAAVAGVILPVAVGLEILAVPGAGWIALYHLYKSSVSAAGGQRLKSYLNKGNDVRVNFAGDPRLDKYVERVDHSPEGVLEDDDIEELCKEVQESSLNHPLMELRNRFIRRHINHKSDYSQLPDSDSGAQEPQSLFLGPNSEGAERQERKDAN